MPAIQRPDADHGASSALSLLLVALLLFAILRFMVVTPRLAIATAPVHLLEMIIDTAKKPVPVKSPTPR